MLALVLVVGILASTLPQPQALGKLPLQNILKNQLHVKPSAMASFFLYCGLFWYIKPLAGILTDAFPIFGTRRRHYLLFSSILAAGAWIVLGFMPRTYGWLLLGAIIVNLFMVMISTVAGAFLVEVGQSRGQVGKMSSVRQVTYNVCYLIQGPVGGLLATMPLMIAGGVNAALVVSIFPVAYFLLKEKPDAMLNPHALANARKQIGVIGRSGTFWISLIFIALFYFAPGFSTLQYYRQNDVLRFRNKPSAGSPRTRCSAGGILLASFGLWLSGKNASRLRASLLFGIVTAAASTMVLYLFYNSLSLARVIDFQNGFCSSASPRWRLIDLAALGRPGGMRRAWGIP